VSECIRAHAIDPATIFYFLSPRVPEFQTPEASSRASMFDNSEANATKWGRKEFRKGFPRQPVAWLRALSWRGSAVRPMSYPRPPGGNGGLLYSFLLSRLPHSFRESAIARDDLAKCVGPEIYGQAGSAGW